MKDLLFHFGITLGKRNTKKQKQIFIEELTKVTEENKWSFEFVNKKKFGFVNTHIVIGDLKKASTVILVAYDTPTKLLIPNQKYYPFKQEKNLLVDQLNLIFQILISTASFIAIYFVLKNVMVWDSVILKLITGFVFLIVFIQLFKLMTGYPNRFNHSRNSAALVLSIDLLKEKKLKNKVAFILVDKASSGMEGYRDIKELKLIRNDKTTLILDALANGEILALATTQQFENNANKLAQSLNLDVLVKAYKEENCEGQIFYYFPKSLMLVSVNRYKNDLVLLKTRTNKDYEINLERLINIRENLKNSFIGESS